MIIPVSQGKFTTIDGEDYSLVGQYRWYINHYGYAVTNVGYKKIFMHRLIMNTPKGLVVDHINHNSLDNQKSNLRNCTRGQNQFNMLIRKDNTSGRKGVRWHKQLKKWNARIHVNGEEISLGCYNNREKASKAYNEAAQKYYGEFANLNKVFIT